MAIDSFAAGVLLVVLTAAFSIFGLVWTRKQFDVQTLRQCHEVGGYLLSVVGTLYAVLLGLVVIDAITRFQTAQNICQQEANSLADIYLLSGSMPSEKKLEIRQLCLDYVNDVIDKK